MNIGKLSNTELKSVILDTINSKRSEVMVRPSIGEDCAIIGVGDSIVALSSDPITGASEEIGRISVAVSCNDIATSGVAPLGIMLTILAPPGTTTDTLSSIMRSASEEADRLNVDIIGGHTEITDAVNRVVISATAIGSGPRENYIDNKKAKDGDVIMMTKCAGLEGTGIIASDLAEEVSAFLTDEEAAHARSFLDSISVVRDGEIAQKSGAAALHDATEGGILGAVWELSMSAGLGCEIHKDAIRVDDVTRKIATHFSIDPLRLISSGCLLIAVPSEKAAIMKAAFEESGIDACAIGRLTASPERIIVDGEKRSIIAEPHSDELYRVI